MTTKIDLKKDFPDYYKAPRKPMRVVLLAAPFITFDGVGAPESDAFQEAVGALYAVVYTLKFSCKQAGNDFAVPALEAFWWAGQLEVMTADPSAIKHVPREEWRWKAMIRVPDFVTESQFREAQKQAFEKKHLESIDGVRFEILEEGACVQVMHVGPYSTEPQSVKQLLEFMEANGLTHAERESIGPHHEIYLSDPRRTAPEKLRTIIRIPVQDAG